MKAAWPCTKDCPKRSAACHNREICPDWGKYEDAYMAQRQAAAAAGKAHRDFAAVRRGALKRSEERKRHNARQKRADQGP